MLSDLWHGLKFSFLSGLLAHELKCNGDELSSFRMFSLLARLILRYEDLLGREDEKQYDFVVSLSLAVAPVLANPVFMSEDELEERVRVLGLS